MERDSRPSYGRHRGRCYRVRGVPTGTKAEAWEELTRGSFCAIRRQSLPDRRGGSHIPPYNRPGRVFTRQEAKNQADAWKAGTAAVHPGSPGLLFDRTTAAVGPTEPIPPCSKRESPGRIPGLSRSGTLKWMAAWATLPPLLLAVWSARHRPPVSCSGRRNTCGSYPGCSRRRSPRRRCCRWSVPGPG